MFKNDADEAVPIVDKTLAALLGFGPRRGRSGADMRNGIGKLRAEIGHLLQTDSIGPPLVNCFELARVAGVTRAQFGDVRRVAAAATPRLAGAIHIKNGIIELSLGTEGRIIADMTFASRSEVEALKAEMNAAFSAIEEETADSMDSMSYRALIILHGAVITYLIETGRPLPRMLDYRFANVLPSLVLSHKLYGTAKRADEIRVENRIVHPAFCPRFGRALTPG